MDAYELIVIGSGPGGVAAARAYTEAGGRGPVLLVTADQDTPYSRPPLSKEALRSPDAPAHEPLVEEGGLDGVELRLSSPVSSVDMAAKRVRIGALEVAYERLVLAPGSRPALLPDLPSDAEFHVLRTVSDLRGLTEAAQHARTAVVVGSGFIGCEAAASLAMRGLDVTVVSPEPGPQQQRLGDRCSAAIRSWLEEAGVHLHHDVEVSSIEAPRRLNLSDGTTLEPDLVLLALGAKPATDLLDGSGLRLDHGRVVVDSGMRASVPDVYAVGDAALAHHPVAGRPVAVEHWGDAETMGEIAGRNAAGGSQQWDSVPGFWSEIGEHTLMYAAWGDGWDTVRVVEDGDAFTVWYGKEGTLVGVLAHENEDDYERGQQLIADGAALDDAVPSR
ncbi:MAG: hypothetical protein JWP82_1453 [Humibacillus sp.]|nr:hypothetical protein [Humibacillus sp.]